MINFQAHDWTLSRPVMAAAQRKRRPSAGSDGCKKDESLDAA